jgi:hypothetical protein
MNLINGDVLVYNATSWVNSSAQAVPATVNNGPVSLGNGGWACGAPNLPGRPAASSWPGAPRADSAAMRRAPGLPTPPALPSGARPPSSLGPGNRATLSVPPRTDQRRDRDEGE